LALLQIFVVVVVVVFGRGCAAAATIRFGMPGCVLAG
jgi:hypothetical protein